MNILIVDDNDVNVRLLATMLGRHNYDIVKANSGFEAIEKYVQHRPDLVLMDIMMPGMDGRECASHLKEMAGDVYIPIIYVTALSQDAALAAALAAGGDDFVSKPINFDILLSKIKAHQRIQELNIELKQKNQQLAIYNQRLEHDQELAAHYFTKALKHNFHDPAVIRHHLSPASAFNGDVLLTASRPGGGIYMILGDFTGHGLGASIGSLPVAQIFFNMTRAGAWIGDIAHEINRELRNLLPDYMFLAATLAEMNSTGERLTVWAGGLPDAYIIDSNKDNHRVIKSQYPPLGILSDDKFNPATESYYVTQGERLYLYTDGVIETKNQQGEIYGAERLHTLLTGDHGDLFEQIIDDIRDFIGNELQIDDTSFVELICQPIDGTDTNETTVDAARPATPYRLMVELGDSEIKSDLDIVSNLTELICATTFTHHKGIVHTIIAEIFTNMLEHGLLNLDSSQKHDEFGFDTYYKKKQDMLTHSDGLLLSFNIDFYPDKPKDRLVITASHNGQNQLRTDAIPMDDGLELPCGRGFLLLQSLCDEVTIDEDGKSLKVVYLA